MCLAGVTGCGRALRARETPSVALLAPFPLSPASRVPSTGPLRDGPGHFVLRPYYDIFHWRGAPSRSTRSPPPRGESRGRGITEKDAEIGKVLSDHGKEFENSEFKSFCEDYGITHQFSALRTPQQNGVVERKNITLVKMTRSMLCENGLSKYFWP